MWVVGCELVVDWTRWQSTASIIFYWVIYKFVAANFLTWIMQLILHQICIISIEQFLNFIHSRLMKFKIRINYLRALIGFPPLL
jgi:hypothetical protein